MKKITLRLPDDVHQELCLIADRQARSLNNQILYLLRQILEGLRHVESVTADAHNAPYHRPGEF
jgi:hypothetical protein